jgi:hypothetical protein
MKVFLNTTSQLEHIVESKKIRNIDLDFSRTFKVLNFIASMSDQVYKK